ncbi:LPXTG cell wall anchor domain-containing protein [Streptomyces sp. O3]
MSYRKHPAALGRVAGVAFGAVLAGSAVLVGAPAAYADVVDVDYMCKTPIGDKGAVSPIDITAEKSGSGYQLTMSFQKGVSESPVELGKGAMEPSAVIKLGGAESGTVSVEGPANAAALPANTPIKISDLTGTYTPKATGEVTFTASTLTIMALGTTTTCEPQNDPKPSLSLDVKGSDGGTSGGTASGGKTSGGGDSGSGDELPKTGPQDNALALGTLGGTVLLTGAAGVLWLTRRNQARR